MKNKLLIVMLLITALSITVYAKGYLPPGAKVTFGDAVEVCSAGYGIVDTCKSGHGCSTDVYCASGNDKHDAKIVKNIVAKWLTK